MTPTPLICSRWVKNRNVLVVFNVFYVCVSPLETFHLQENDVRALNSMASSVGVGEDPSNANNAPDLSSSTSSFSQDDGQHDFVDICITLYIILLNFCEGEKKSTSACSLPCSRGAQKRGSFQKLDDPE